VGLGVSHFDLEEILWGTIDFVKGLLARVWDGLHPESTTRFRVSRKTYLERLVGDEYDESEVRKEE